ncbi:MAG: heme exporter protein CcmB [Burkholderiales bacterium]
MNVFTVILRRDLLLALRRKSDLGMSLFFFIMVTSLFPLAIGPETAQLRAIAPGVVWVAALLASMLSLPRMFESDFLDGTLEQMLLSPQPLALIALAKIFAHWLGACLPLVLIAPLLALQFGLDSRAILMLCLSLTLGTPLLSLLGAIGAALTLGVRGGGVLVALLLMPLYVPVLIFGAGVVDADSSGIGAAANFSLLGALFAASLFLAPLGTAAALRIALE